MNSSKLIVINTIAQYARTILSMLLSLLATRLILKSLGVEDYGIYSVVAGAVSILSFLTSSLVITTQRYLSVCQGEKNFEKTSKIFSNSFFLHIIITAIVFVLLEVLYFFLFNGVLNIPENKIQSARILYQLVSLVLGLTFLTSPYRAVLVSHENIVYVSIIEVADAIFKLIAAYLLYFVTIDKLVAYGSCLVAIQLFNIAALGLYSSFKYSECKSISLKLFDYRFVKNMFSFAGWTMYNLICNLGRTQGIAIALNKFMGPAVNASYGLSFQVSGALGNVSQSLINAINPQLMKAEGSGDRNKMLRFAEIESKFAYFFLVAISVPAIAEMPRLLELWLGQIPEHSVLFCRMVIIAAICDTITTGLGSANQAIGNIKKYTLCISSMKLFTLPVAVILLLCGLPISSIAIAYVSIELITAIIRIPFLHRIADLSIQEYMNNVFLRLIFPTLCISVVCTSFVLILDGPFRFIWTFSESILSYVIIVFFVGLSRDEKEIIRKYINRLLKG